MLCDKYKSPGYKKLTIYFNKDLILTNIYNNNFFIVTSEERKTIKNFIEALTCYNFEEAKLYISKDFIYLFNFEELLKNFNLDYKFLNNIYFKQIPEMYVNISILVKHDDKNSIIHLGMVKEHNSFGKWKIYNIEKEMG